MGASGSPTPEIPRKMRAVQYDAYGEGAAGLKHVEVPVPSPKKNQLLLKLEATSINPVDWKMKKGVLRPLFPLRLPHIPANDVAGVVVAVGPGVDGFKPGDKVVAMLNVFYGGGLADFAVASVKLTVKRPPSVSAAEGAGLPTAAGTALQSLRAIGARFDGTTKPKKPLNNVLITAASGGVGHYAVQLAKAAGLHVTATCGARNAELVQSLGADEVLDYATPEGGSLRSPSGKKYDGVVHCAGVAFPWSAFEPVLAGAGGTVVVVTGTVGVVLRSVVHRVTFARKRMVPILLWPNTADLELLVGMVEEGRLRTVVDSRFPLSRAGEAWEKSAGGHATGKVMVEIMEGSS